MTLETPSRPIVVALIGNPNSGKTTVFNALTGLRQKVGNYPGVTVERREGHAQLADGRELRVIDLPGTYSLANRAPDEQIAVDVILGRRGAEERPDVLINVCDASNLARNLYLTTQLVELGLPVVVALNMMDVCRRRGRVPRAEGLEAELGVPVVALEDHGRESIAALERAAAEAATGGAPRPCVAHPPAIAAAVGELTAGHGGGAPPFGAVLRDLVADLDDSDTSETVLDRERLRAVQSRLDAQDASWWKAEAASRYVWIDERLPAILPGDPTAAPRRTERVDAIVLHRVAGPIIFLAVMAAIFQGIFTWASGPTDLLEAGFGTLSTAVAELIGPGLLQDLVVDGVLGGVLNVVVFLPQILILFLALGLLEDSGYLARAAFIMDRLMRRVGLHGRSFVPMMSSFACAVPGVMATRTIESPGARLVTILVAPLMSCSARLPVYTLVISAFFADTRIGFLSAGAVILLSMYLLGIVAAGAMALLFRRTLIRGETPALIMELPPYRMPRPGAIVRHVADRALLFLRKVWTVILTLTIVLWFLQTFPRDAGALERFESANAELTAKLGAATSPERTSEIEARLHALEIDFRADRLRHSWAGRMGHAIEPLIAPLGFDWKIGIGLLASFAAREVLVSTLAQVYAVEDSDEGVTFLANRLATATRDDGSRAFRPLTGVSLMVFFVLACQCMSTVAVVRRETNGWRWPLFMVGYMTVLAWVGSFLTYSVGSAMGF